MSANRTFDPNVPDEALAGLEALMASDGISWNTATHRFIDQAFATLKRSLSEAKEPAELKLVESESAS